MNLNKVDKIILRSKEEVDRLLHWRDLNKDLVREFVPSLTEGLITYQNYRQYFKQDGKTVTYRVWFGDEEVAIAVVKIVEGGYTVVDFNTSLTAKDINEVIQDMTTIHASLMAYMAHYKHHVSERRETTLKTKKGKQKGGKKVKDRVIKIGRKVYDVDVPAPISTDKRPYERQAKRWDVTGHWRTYKKSGKRIWISTYTKGDNNAEKEPKTYKL